MATAVPDTDDILTCPICFEQFTTPKYLPCLHTYCRLCLKSYIITQLGGEGKKAGTFPCPVCREVVNIDHNVTSEKIVDTIPGNHMITSLIDRSKVTKCEKYCDPCSVQNQTTTAIWWCTSCQEAMCENCTTLHKQFKMSRNHVTVAIGDVSDDLSKLSVVESEEPCIKHAGNMLHVYCVDHKKLCCVVCLATNHRKCEHISSIDEMVTVTDGDQTISNFTEILDQIDHVTGEMRVKTDETINRLDVQRDKMTQKVATTVKMAKDKLDQLQVEFETEFQIKQQSLKLSERRDKVDIFHQNVKKGKKLLETVRELGSPRQLFIAKEKLKTQLQDQMISLKIDTKGLACVGYTFNKDLNECTFKMANLVLSVPHSLTEVDINPSDAAFDLTANMTRVEHMVNALGERKLECLPKGSAESFDVTKLKVTKVCSIKGEFYGGTYIPDGRLILCNYFGETVDVFDKDGSFLFHIKPSMDGRTDASFFSLRDRPADVCCVSQNWILVSFPDTNRITWFNVTGSQLKKSNSTRCIDCPSGLAVTENKLIIGCEDTVKIIRYENDLHRSKKKLSSRQPSFPSYVATSSAGNVFYGDGNAVVCKTLHGTELARFTNPELKHICGLAVDKYGNVYASGADSNNVFVFSPDGKQSKVLIQNTPYPKCIGFDSDGTNFFVTRSFGADIYICETM